ncbi:hypothetical protein ACP275_03G123400 [Erythranthe tilingii]
MSALTDVLGTGKNENLISELSDDILVSILSLLPTKVATRTSLLSRRWRNLYKFISKIELSCQCLLGLSSAGLNPHNSEAIMDALDRFFRLRSDSKIRSFRLSCCLYESVTDRFEQFISSLELLGVEKIRLKCCCSQSISDLSFSCHLFSKMPSLKKFGLRNCSLQPSLGSHCNKSLRSIALMHVTVSDGAVECILSNCSSLQSLTMTRCHFSSKLSFCGPNLELNSLYIRECGGIEEIEFYASNLVAFEFWNLKLADLKFDHVPRLQSIFLYIFSENIVPFVFGRLAVDVPCLKSLNFVTMHDHFQESNRRMKTNMFNNLRRLDIDMRFVPGSDLRLLTSILQSCPLLREFHLSATYWREGPPVEKQAIVFHSELKKMEISGFRGAEYEIEFALYILKSAINLEKMQISACFKVYWGVYEGSSSWFEMNAEPWTQKVRAKIRGKLQGQAVSKTAQLSLQHKPHIDD